MALTTKKIYCPRLTMLFVASPFIAIPAKLSRRLPASAAVLPAAVRTICRLRGRKSSRLPLPTMRVPRLHTACFPDTVYLLAL